MRIKKSGGKIFGGELTVAEQKALDIIIQKEVAEMNEKNALEIDAIILWIIHEESGYGHTRLRRFYKKFVKRVRELNKRYKLDYGDRVWYCTKQLEEYGIDIKKLSAEIDKEIAEEEREEAKKDA